MNSPATEDDMLREAARARGFRLVKSRRRKPGGDFGRYGLVGLDSGRECLGFGEGGLTATADEVLAYLRGGEVASWKRSLIGVVGDADAVPARPERSRAAPPQPGPKVQPGAKSPPKPRKNPRHPRKRGDPASSLRLKKKEEKLDFPFAGNDEVDAHQSSRPSLTVRDATRRDAAALAKLLGLPAATLAERLAAAIRAGEVPLVADRNGPVGLIAWTAIAALQHGPRARITLLFVAPDERRQGLGSLLLAEAEARLAAAGVTDAELMLEIDLDAPAGFLRRAGYTRTINGYGKAL